MQQKFLMSTIKKNFREQSFVKYVHQLWMPVICEYAIAYFAKTHILHIFPHIMAFSKSHYAKIMPHTQKFAYMLHISAYAIAFSLSNVHLKLLNIL